MVLDIRSRFSLRRRTKEASEAISKGLESLESGGIGLDVGTTREDVLKRRGYVLGARILLTLSHK